MSEIGAREQSSTDTAPVQGSRWCPDGSAATVELSAGSQVMVESVGSYLLTSYQDPPPPPPDPPPAENPPPPPLLADCDAAYEEIAPSETDEIVDDRARLK